MKSFPLRHPLRALALAVALSPLASHAAIDTASALAGVSDAQTAVVAVLGIMITMAAAIFGLRKVLKLLGR